MMLALVPASTCNEHTERLGRVARVRRRIVSFKQLQFRRGSFPLEASVQEAISQMPAEGVFNVQLDAVRPRLQNSNWEMCPGEPTRTFNQDK